MMVQLMAMITAIFSGKSNMKRKKVYHIPKGISNTYSIEFQLSLNRRDLYESFEKHRQFKLVLQRNHTFSQYGHKFRTDWVRFETFSSTNYIKCEITLDF